MMRAMLQRRGARRALRWAALAAFVSCDVPTTQLLVGVDSELPWGERGTIQSVTLEIHRGDSSGPLRSRRSTGLGSGNGRAQLPLWVTVVSTGDDDPSPLWIEALGCLTPDGCTRETAAVAQRASVRFTPGAVTTVQLLLANACRMVRCALSERCSPADGQCIAVDAQRELRAYDGRLPGRWADAATAADATDATAADATAADATAATDAATGDVGMDATDAADVARADVVGDAMADAVRSDVAGDAAPPACATGQTLCGSGCVNLTTDASHCGGCGRACTMTQRCLGGACTPATPMAQSSCTVPGTAGCGMVRFAGGTFLQGDIGATNATPTMMTTVGPFAIDAYEVTVARFRVFWAARTTTAAPAILRLLPVAYRTGSLSWPERPAGPPYVMDAARFNWSETDPSVTAHPMNGIDFLLAQEFCVWDGGRLPTEAEWEFAARGRVAPSPSDRGPSYPWGDALPLGSAGTSCQRAHFTQCVGDDRRPTRRVGHFADSGGLFDMAGNVAEYTADDFQTYGATPPCRTSATDPLCILNGSMTGTHVRRGGSYADAAQEIRAAARLPANFTDSNSEIGFRCARTLP